MSDDPRKTAFDDRASPDERQQANAELQKAYMPLQSALMPGDAAQQVIDFIRDDLAQQEMAKARNVIPFPKKTRDADRGMRSVAIDDWLLKVQGEYYERPGTLSFQSLRDMVDRTPVLNAVIMTRQRQVGFFTRVSESDDTPGFGIRHIDKDHQLTDAEQKSIHELQRFVLNSGWEFKPRRRQRLKRSSFQHFAAKLVRDSLTLDSAPIETEFKRDKGLGIDGFYNVDGATIRLCTEEGYEGDDEVFALQVVEGRIRTAYTYDDLIYVPRNPRTDVEYGGYGMPETELLIRVVTGFLNAMTYNIKGFDENALPHGVMHLVGDYDNRDLNAFKRYWNAMVKGVNNAWTVPLLVSKDQDSKASFERFGVEFNEMYFSKWMTFLVSIICALFAMSPDEINFESFTAGRSPLSGSDTAEQLSYSHDKGLRPILTYLESLIGDYIIGDFSEKFVFRFVGLDPEDKDKRFEMRKLTQTVNEARAQEGSEPLEGPIGDAPLNPNLLSVWQQMQQAQAGDGAPGEPQQPDQGQQKLDFGAAPEEHNDKAGAAKDGAQARREEQPSNAGDGGDYGSTAAPDGDYGMKGLTIYGLE